MKALLTALLPALTVSVVDKTVKKSLIRTLNEAQGGDFNLKLIKNR